MAVNLHGISRAAFDLIVESEVSSKAAYDRKYRRPERPGGQSGITVGIGYDCGYSTAATIRQDWGGKIPAAMVTTLTSVAGLKGQSAQNALNSVRPKVDVPWDAAIDVFSNVSIPKYLGFARKGLPGLDDMSPDCKGVLLSLVYNRGASFQQAGARYAEMRAIRAAVISGDLALIPGLLRKMKRLWTTPSVRGVALRREEEARLFERGLKGVAAPAVSEMEIDGTEPQTPEEAPPNVQPLDPSVRGDPVLFEVQQRLKGRRYPPGILDGKWGSGTRGALSGFMGDRGRKVTMPTSLEEFHEIADDVRAELLEAETEVQPDGSVGWFRPVSEARANADPKIIRELAPEVAPVKRNFFSALGASILAFLSSLWETISGYVSEAWNFFTDHKDVVDDNPGILSTAWGYVSSIPSGFWLFAGGCGLAFIAYNSWRAIKTSTQAVKNGERQ